MINHRVNIFLFIASLFSISLYPLYNSYSKDNLTTLSCDISPQESTYLLNQIRLDNKMPIKAMDDCKKNNRHFIAKVIDMNPNYFEFASDALRDDEVFISKFVAINPQILKYISERLSNDKFFMLKMAAIYPEAIQYASAQLTDNKNFMIKMIELNPKNFSYASERIQNDKEAALLAVRKNGKMLRFASEKLQDDREIVIEAIKSYNLAINFASEKLRNDPKIKKIASEIDYSFLTNFDQFLRENYGGLGVGPDGYRGYHIVNMAKNFPEKRIIYQPYLTKWQRVYQNGVEMTELKLSSKINTTNDWKSVFSKYRGLSKEVEKIFSNNKVDDNTVDALNLVSFWVISKKPRIVAFNLYLLRPIDNAYLDANVANIVSMTAIAKENQNKEWQISVVDAIFDADLKMSVDYKSGHKIYKIWDVYQINKNDQNFKILFKVEDKDGEYFDLFAKQLNGRYVSIHKGGGYAMEINILGD